VRGVVKNQEGITRRGVSVPEAGGISRACKWGSGLFKEMEKKKKSQLVELSALKTSRRGQGTPQTCVRGKKQQTHV